MAGKYLLYFLFEDMCGNDIRKIPTPSGENVAYIFDRSCGATTGFLNRQDCEKVKGDINL